MLICWKALQPQPLSLSPAALTCAESGKKRCSHSAAARVISVDFGQSLASAPPPAASAASSCLSSATSKAAAAEQNWSRAGGALLLPAP